MMRVRRERKGWKHERGSKGKEAVTMMVGCRKQSDILPIAK